MRCGGGGEGVGGYDGNEDREKGTNTRKDETKEGKENVLSEHEEQMKNRPIAGQNENKQRRIGELLNRNRDKAWEVTAFKIMQV